MACRKQSTSPLCLLPQEIPSQSGPEGSYFEGSLCLRRKIQLINFQATPTPKRRRTPRMCNVQRQIPLSPGSQTPRKQAYGRETPPMPSLLTHIPTCLQPPGAHRQPFWQESVPVEILRTKLPAKASAPEARAAARGRRPLQATATFAQACILPSARK